MIQIYLGIRLYQKFHECHTLVQVLSCLVNGKPLVTLAQSSLGLASLCKGSFTKLKVYQQKASFQQYSPSYIYNMLRAKLLSISFSVVDVICGFFCCQGNKNELVAAKTTVCSQTRWRKDGNLRKNLFLVLKTNRI